MADGQVAAPAGAAGDEAGFSCTCTKETWPTVLFGLGFGGSVLVCIVAVTQIIGNATTAIVLNIYLFLFGLIGCAAELRTFKSLRSIMFFVVKHVYFVARPMGRGLFYLFVASLTWTSEFQLLPWITAILMALVAVMTLGVDLAVGLPVYMDKEVEQTLNQAVRGAATDIAIDQAKKEAMSSMNGGGGRRI